MTTTYFHQFPLLPKELRVQIWKNALPEPRIIELNLIDKLHPTLYLWQTHGEDDNEFVWETASPPINIPLLRASREARLATLESYENKGIYYHGTNTWTYVYVDFSRDTFYLNRDEHMHVMCGFAMDIPEDLYWTARVQNLAVNLGMFAIRNIGEIPRYSRFEQFWTPEGQADVIRDLLDIFENFPALKKFNFALDGRNPIFGGPVEIIEPTAEFEDYWEPDGRTLASAWIPDTLSELHRQRPQVRIPPQVGLKLLTNGKDMEHLERRWDYCYACCRFVEPGYQGHRSNASSEYDSYGEEEEESNEDSNIAVDSDGAS